MNYAQNFNTKKLEDEQIRLSKKVVNRDEFDVSNVKTVAGCNQAFIGRKIISGVVVCDINTMAVLEKKYAIVEAKMPYIPGFMGFRECPAVIEAYSRLSIQPDIVILEGHGILHPRRFGFACQMGLALDKPTIGIAKSLLAGEVTENRIYVDDELRGQEVRTKEFAKPLYVSPGHMITLKTAVEIINKCIRPPHKLPEPLHIAQRYADKIREKELEKQSQVKSAQEEAMQSPAKAAAMYFNL